MILAKTRMTTAPSHTDARAAGATTGRALRTSGVSSTKTSDKHVEISFLLPLQEGMELIKSLKGADGNDASPILLWAGRKGEVDIIVRERDANSPAGAAEKTLVSARARCELPSEVTGARPELEKIDLHDLAINPGRHEVLHRGVPTPQLTFTEFGILHFLARHPGWVFSRQQIVEGVKGPDYPVTDRAVDVQVAGLRKKLGEAAPYVQTVRGVGYRFRD